MTYGKLENSFPTKLYSKLDESLSNRKLATVNVAKYDEETSKSKEIRVLKMMNYANGINLH
jgi:hypothetical protein